MTNPEEIGYRVKRDNPAFQTTLGQDVTNYIDPAKLTAGNGYRYSVNPIYSTGEKECASILVTCPSVPTSTPTPTATNTPTPTPTNTPTITPTPILGSSYCVNIVSNYTSGRAPLVVRFTGQGYDSAGSVKKYRFHFGDGTASAEIHSNWVEHVYSNAGKYHPWLEVLDQGDHWQTRTECNTEITVTGSNEVLGVEAPPALPKTGFSMVGLIVIGLVGLVIRVLPLII